MLKSLSICLLFLSFLYTPTALRADTQTEQCVKQTQEYRNQLRHYMLRYEAALYQKNWKVLRHHEMMYNAWWDAKIKMKDSLNQDWQSKAEMLEFRYKTQDQELRKQIQELRQQMEKDWFDASKMNSRLAGVCPAHVYRMCFIFWRDEIDLKLKELREKNKRWDKEEGRISRRIYKSLSADTPSDHEPLGHRFQDKYRKWSTQTHPAMARLIREILESIDHECPIENCCEKCLPDADLENYDPILQEIKPNDEGSDAIKRDLLKPPSLVDAFEELHAEKPEEEKSSG